MASVPYPFIDIAVLDTVRDRLAAGDAVLIVTASLDSVIFANGTGARLAGFDNPVDLTGNDPELGVSAKRQIGALDLGDLRGKSAMIALRITSGVESRMVMISVSPVRLPDGGQAIMISAPAEGGIRNAIDGLASEGSHAAILDAEGGIIVSSPEFDGLNVDAQELRRLANSALSARDRMVKQRIQAGQRTYPAGIGRIGDEPGQFILLVIEDKSQPIVPTVMERPAQSFGKRAAPESEPASKADRWYFHGDRFAGAASTGRVNDTGKSPSPTVPAAIPAAANESMKLTKDASPTPNAAVSLAVTAVSEPHRPAIDSESAPVRFTWKIDAAGFFSMISPEFGQTVGKHAADVEGRTFAEVAQVFAMDPSGEIRDLLERHDTWSGRSVLWPIEGTDLRAPVDLAALPVYDRERRFEGFRGFGIVRVADAVVDPEAIGIALAQRSQATDLAPGRLSPLSEPDTNPLVETAVDDTAHDPWQGEKPALELTSGRLALPMADKVIRLEERRQPRQTAGDNVLSPVERSAFREIAERLRREGLMAATAEGAPASEDKPATQTILSDNENDTALTEPSAILQDVEATNDQTHTQSDTKPEPVLGTTDDGESAADLTYGDDVEDQHEIEALVRLDQSADEYLLSQDAALDEDLQAVNRVDPQGLNEPSDEEFLGDESYAVDVEDSEDGNAGANAAQADSEGDAAGDGADQEIDEAPILSRLPVPILVHNGSDLLFANQAFFDLTGFASLAALNGVGGLDRLFVRDDDSESDVAHLNSILRTAYDDLVPVRAHLHSVPWKGGHALLLSMRLIDVHALEAQSGDENDADVAALKQEVSELSSVLETATDGVVFVHEDGTVRAITQSAEALFGFDPAEVRGKPFTVLFATESQRAVSDYLANLSGTGVASLINDGREVIGRESHGRFIPLFMTIGRLSGSTGYCAVMRDITQWKRAEEELNAARRAAEHASTQKSEFLARVSHEIRTPLNAIIGFSDLMTEERFGPVGNLRYLDYLKDINRSGRHVLDLVNDLLDISKIEAGQQEMDFEAVSLNESLAEAVSMMQPQANRDRVIIRSSFASDLPDVVADLRSVKQIALNLLSNAVRYTGAGGQVIVSTAYELTGGVVIRVRDTGIGMTTQEIEQALKPFKQINALNRERGDGTGLGLPLTKAMVEANRASFTITSTPSQGTLVEITFPSTRVLAD